jgi:GNAT superfamily N-acetyltransferase
LSTASSTTCTIRRAVASDLPAVAALLDQRNAEQGFANVPGEAGARRALAGLDPAQVIAIVAVDDGRIVGLSAVQLHALRHEGRDLPTAYWTNLYLLPSHRARGLFASMVSALRATASAEGRFIMCLMRREAVIRRQERIGFVRLGPLRVRAKLLVPPVSWTLDALARAGNLARRDVAIDALRDRPRLFGTDAASCADDRITRTWTASTLRARAERSPDGVDYEVLTLGGGAGLGGATAVWRPTRRRGVRLGVVMTARGARVRDVLRVLVACEARATQRGCLGLVALDGEGPPSSRALDLLGFVPTPEQYQLVVDDNPQAPRLPVAAWRLSFLDHDAF